MAKMTMKKFEGTPADRKVDTAAIKKINAKGSPKKKEEEKGKKKK